MSLLSTPSLSPSPSVSPPSIFPTSSCPLLSPCRPSLLPHLSSFNLLTAHLPHSSLLQCSHPQCLLSTIWPPYNLAPLNLPPILSLAPSFILPLLLFYTFLLSFSCTALLLSFFLLLLSSFLLTPLSFIYTF
jgi:hypothetical protein